MTDTTVGTKLPKVKLDASGGRTVQLPDDFLGKWTLLYFYPKDDTPGCTKQACNYRDSLEEFEKLGVVVFGVSLDDIRSHEEFTGKYNLNFPLLADVDHKLSDALGVYGDQRFMGIKYTGLSRDTFLIDTEGVVREVWRKVKPGSTVDETLEFVKNKITK